MLATMFQRGSIKALNIPIANISCDRSITLLPNGEQTIAGQLEKHVFKHMLAILTA